MKDLTQKIGFLYRAILTDTKLRAMKKWKMLILIALYAGLAYSQPNRLTAMVKLLKDNYPNKSDSIRGIMLSGLYRLRESVSDAIIEFRVKCNPEINPKTVYDTILKR